jgi:hypothetical protein
MEKRMQELSVFIEGIWSYKNEKVARKVACQK